MDSRIVKNPQGQISKPRMQSTAFIYFGTNGDIFDRLKRQRFDEFHANHFYEQVDIAGPSSDVNSYKLYWQFVDKSLIANEKFHIGARNISISFDKRYTHCLSSIIYGKDPIKHNIIYSDWKDHIQYELINISISNVRCKITNKNVFAD
jgi:hypothetical protein